MIKNLNKEEVQARIREKKVNTYKKKTYTSHFKIFIDSFLSFYNLILYAVAAVFIIYSCFNKDIIPISKYGFLFIVLFNGLTSFITQEKSRKTLQKLNLLTRNQISVIRDNKEQTIFTDEIVLDDLIILKSGDQVPCDIKVIEGSAKLDESILTGESKAILKETDDELLSGSLLISGYIKGHAIRVGQDCYINKLEDKVLKIYKKTSILEKNVKKLILFLVLMMIPSSLIVFIKTLWINNWVINSEVLTKTSTIVVGMIPIGMILLTSVTLASSIIKLSKSNVLTKELYALENLSRIDCLALDKTGTITTNNLKVVKIIELEENNLNLLSKFIYSFEDDNKTSLAIKNYIKEDISFKAKVSDISPFESSKKYSSLKINDEKYYLGAPEILIKDQKVLSNAQSYMKEGYRVLVFKNEIKELCFIVLEDEIRPNVEATLSNFNKLGISIKIISGDSINTVTAIAKKVGISDFDNAVSLENMNLDEVEKIALKYTIFGRATPEQKEVIIKTLEKNGIKVGYIGDGVNDIISLRSATCSIGLKSGSTSSKAISDFVLLDDDFNSLSIILNEGKRVVRNIERSCLLFLTKGVFFFFTSIVSFVFKGGLLIDIESIYVFEFITIALCGFLLSLENAYPSKLEDGFVKNVFLKSLISGFYLFLLVLPTSILANTTSDFIGNPFGMTSILITFGGLFVLFELTRPLNKYLKIVIGIGTGLSIFLLLFAPAVFLESGYFLKAHTIIGQLKLIIQALFNYEILKTFNLNSCYIIISSFVIGSFIYYITLRILNKKNLLK